MKVMKLMKILRLIVRSHVSRIHIFVSIVPNIFKTMPLTWWASIVGRFCCWDSVYSGTINGFLGCIGSWLTPANAGVANTFVEGLVATDCDLKILELSHRSWCRYGSSITVSKSWGIILTSEQLVSTYEREWETICSCGSFSMLLV